MFSVTASIIIIKARRRKSVKPRGADKPAEKSYEEQVAAIREMPVPEQEADLKDTRRALEEAQEIEITDIPPAKTETHVHWKARLKESKLSLRSTTQALAKEEKAWSNFNKPVVTLAGNRTKTNFITILARSIHTKSVSKEDVVYLVDKIGVPFAKR